MMRSQVKALQELMKRANLNAKGLQKCEREWGSFIASLTIVSFFVRFITPKKTMGKASLQNDF